MARTVQVRVTGVEEELVTYPVDVVPSDVTFYQKDGITYAQFWKRGELITIPAWKIVSID